VRKVTPIACFAAREVHRDEHISINSDCGWGGYVFEGAGDRCLDCKEVDVCECVAQAEMMLAGQQPYTTVFYEVHDAEGREEVHILQREVTYDMKDESTYTRGSVAKSEGLCETQQTIRLYLPDSRAASESRLNNGVVNILFIDAPSLNVSTSGP
jgi:hypothetical protein